MKYIVVISIILAQTVSAQWQYTDALTGARPTKAELQEQYAMIALVNRNSLTFHAAVIQKMLPEANYFANRLNLPTKRPVEITDIQDTYIGSTWDNIIREHYPTEHGYIPATVFTTSIFDSNIPRDKRLHALKFGVSGYFDTTNFEFNFNQGKLIQIMRLDAPQTEYYARRLDELIGKPSLIDTNGAYQLATQWLAAVNVDMAIVNKFKWKVSQLLVLPIGATNPVPVPIYYVDFGSLHFPASGNLKARDEPLIEVEVLGTTKELQLMKLADDYIGGELPYFRRPLLLITNALDLIRTPNPTVKQLQNPATARAYALTPTQVSNYTKNFQSSSGAQTNSTKKPKLH